MAKVNRPTRPVAGDPVDVLWKHVDRLIDTVNLQAVKIAELESRLPRRRLLDTSAGGGVDCYGVMTNPPPSGT